MPVDESSARHAIDKFVANYPPFKLREAIHGNEHSRRPLCDPELRFIEVENTWPRV